MHIVTPAYTVNEVPLLVHAGADWLYTMWMPDGIQSRFHVPPPTYPLASIFAPKDIGDLQALTQGAHHLSALLLLKLGASTYSADDHSRLGIQVVQALDAGVDGFIFSDLGVLPTLARAAGTKILMASPEVFVGNHKAAELLCRAGANHIVLGPRLALSELREMVSRVPGELGIGYLIFNGAFIHCFYDPALCNTVHAGKNYCDWDLEWHPYTYSVEGPDLNYDRCRQIKENEFWHQQWLNPFSYFAAHVDDWRSSGCGLCALPAALAGGRVGFLYVGGEHHTFTRRLNATEFVRRAHALAARGAAPAEIREALRAVQPNPELCNLGYRCLFPDAVSA